MTAAKGRELGFACAYALCLCWLLYPGLFFSQVPAFRDGFHFYFPQAIWLDQCASEGDLFPRWNADEGLGVSVSGQATAAIYYPLRVLWMLPGFSVAQRYSIFIFAHLLLAAVGMRYAAGKLSVSTEAAWLAGIAYGLSCPVFFQHCNLIYLTSAAWIGFAFAAVFSFCLMPADRFLRSSLGLSFATAMMLLGGDPHTAINALIVASLIVLLISIFALSKYSARERRGEGADALRDLAPHPPTPSPRVQGEGEPRAGRIAAVGKSAAWLAVTVFAFLALTAIQTLPMLRWAQASDRLADTSMPAVSPHQLSTEHASLLQEISATELPERRIYDFSLSPWHVATAIWPTLGGHHLPTHSRWFAAIPSEGRMWSPSIYFGFVPCLLAFVCFTSKASARSRWLIALAGLCLMTAMGNYSLVWMFRELLTGIGMNAIADSLPKDRVASPYWLLTQIVPGYDAFRYPAKWSVWFVAACSLAAACSFDGMGQGGERAKMLSQKRDLPLWRAALVLSTAWTVAAAGVLMWSYSQSTIFGGAVQLDDWLAQHAPDVWLGPPTTQSAAWSVFIAGLLPVSVWALTGRLPTQGPKSLVYLTLFEMSMVASCWISFAPAPEASSVRLASTDNPRPFVWVDGSEADFRRDDGAGEGEQYLKTQAEYQQTFVIGKLASIEAVACLSATQAIDPLLVRQTRGWLARRDDLSRVQPELDNMLRRLGVTHRLVRWHGQETEAASFAWQPVADTRPVCELIEAAVDGSPPAMTVDWVWKTRSELLITAVADRPAHLLVRQFNDGGWQASLTIDDQPPRALRIVEPPTLFIEAELPAGNSTITLRRRW